jgi:hypothetical protein
MGLQDKGCAYLEHSDIIIGYGAWKRSNRSHQGVMRIVETHSVRNAKRLLKERGALSSCHAIVERYDGRPEENEDALRDLGFEPERSFNAGGNRPRFDAFSQEWKVGIEREMREQMNVRSHILFAEIAYQKGLIEIGVFILPMRGKGTFGRTVREVTEYDVFTEYFPLELPLYLIGCETES